MKRHAIALILTLFATAPAHAQPATGASAQPARPQQPVPSPEVSAAEEAFGKQDWKTAVEKYKAAIAKGDAGGGLTNLRLGYSLHMLKRYDEAFEYHLKTAHSQNRPIRIDGLYNAACVSALLGKKDQAIEFLAKAIDAGFADREQVEGDSDLDNVKSDERFKKLFASLGTAPTLHQQLDFFIGAWTCEDLDGHRIEDVTITRPLPGSSSMVSAISTAQGAQFTGLISPVAADRAWIWTYADNIGSTTSLVGVCDASRSVCFTGKVLSPAGTALHLRLTFSPRPDGTIRETAEVSDDGTAWRTHHEAVYRKKAEAPSAAPASR